MALSSKAEKLKSILENRKGIIFDFDGLIVDSEPFHYRAYSEVFKKYGHTIDPDEYWVEFTSKGKGIAGEVERYNLKLDVKPEDMRQEKFDIYSRFCKAGEIKMFPDARKLVELLKTRFSIAIASGSWGHDIRAILSHADARQLFPIILGKESSAREKPHPDIFLNAAEAMGCPPTSCVVLEDALKGLTAAKQAGMACIIVRNRLNQNIEFQGADLIVSGLGEIISLIEQ
ncbi:MAG: phosphatase [Nitrospinae bacterium RIFCSPLOWO2_12_FULL_47_7]|nr:MAG: phosphatase [Nitrospinae bacterium RIFCSPLOWO2_12_FULL_47_7]